MGSRYPFGKYSDFSRLHQGGIPLALMVVSEKVQHAVDQKMRDMRVHRLALFTRFAFACLPGDGDVTKLLGHVRRAGPGGIGSAAIGVRAPFLGRPGKHVRGLRLAAKPGVEFGDALVGTAKQADRKTLVRKAKIGKTTPRGTVGQRVQTQGLPARILDQGVNQRLHPRRHRLR